MTLLLALLAVLLSALPSAGQTFFNPGRVAFSGLGTPANGAQVYCTDCTFGSNPCTGAGTGAMAFRVNGAWTCADDSTAASGTTGLIGIDSITLVDGSLTLFMSAGSGVDSLEAEVEQKVKSAMTLENLQCIGSADPGAGETIVVTGRSGTCGGLGDSGTFTCTLTGGSGRPACNTGSNTLGLGAGQCWSIKLTFGSALATPVFVNCTAERTS